MMILSLTSYLALQLKIYLYYRLDIAIEEGFRYLEHHDAKPELLKMLIVQVF